MMKFQFLISRFVICVCLLLATSHAFAGALPYRLVKTTASRVKGSILLLPSMPEEYSGPLFTTAKTLAFLSKQGFDVVILSATTSKKTGKAQRSLPDLLDSYHYFSRGAGKRELRVLPLTIVGFQSAGKQAASMLETIPPAEQPASVLLINPSGFSQTVPGTVIPQVMPPLFPSARLYAVFLGQGELQESNAGIQYVKKYIGFGGQGMYKLVSKADPPFKLEQLQTWYPDFFQQAVHLAGAAASYPVPERENPAAIPVEGYSKARHEEKVALVAREKFNLIMIGNSITNNFEKPEYQAVWNQFFAPRKALNLGFSGYRTENLLWNIDHGELQGQSPKVIVLEIGTNNVDEKNYPTRHTAQQLAGGITAIVQRFRSKMPDARIILLRCFPGSYDGPNPTSHRAILERASDLVSKLDDGQHVFYCDVNHVFLNLDGSVNHQMMGDYLHPTPAGAKAWAQAMEPLLSDLMGDQSLDREIPANTAIVPVSRLEMDSYNWYDRHAAVLAIKDSINPEIVQIGNSITHFWGGLPSLRYPDGKVRIPNGPKSYAALFGKYRVVNMGFGWDRTQNVLWRLDHGELDGLHPKVVVVNIGTNNTSETEHARMNTPAEIVMGISAVCARIRAKVPRARIVVMAIFPREEEPTHPRRILIQEINRQLESFAKSNQLTFLDIGSKLLKPDGHFLPGMMLDFTHPSERGYEIWADGLRPIFKTELLR
jgi:lysophospholipase L1-like esterase